jgi:hypothetical protein
VLSAQDTLAECTGKSFARQLIGENNSAASQRHALLSPEHMFVQQFVAIT